jgi:hypothetical protein
MTPFQALYGINPLLPNGAPRRSEVEAITVVLHERHKVIGEKSFQVGEWVYLKLQPYSQVQ